MKKGGWNSFRPTAPPPEKLGAGACRSVRGPVRLKSGAESVGGTRSGRFPAVGQKGFRRRPSGLTAFLLGVSALMSTASQDSSLDYDFNAIPAPRPPGEVLTSADGTFWLDGDVLACSCPDCGAPMSIRLWLMVADCFRCGTSIELTEEQEREALDLLKQAENAKRAESQAAAAAISPTMLRKPKPRPATEPPTQPDAEPAAKPAPAAPSEPSEPAVRPRQRRVAAAQTYRGARAHVREIYEKGGVAVWLGNFFRDLPAWLVSAVIHLVAMLLLALWIDETPTDEETITLATNVSHEELIGDEFQPDESELDSFDFDDAGAIEMLEEVEPDLGAPTEEAIMDPVTPPIDEPNPVGRLPSSVTRPTDFSPPANLGRMYSGRNPEARARLAKEAGGTSMTEAAVARALKWLARHQFEDGRWSLHEFHKAPDADEGLGGQARGAKNDVAATALALLPFLGAGQTHRQGQYQEEVFSGLKWLVEEQKEDGDLRGNRSGNTGMYAHGQAAIALCEAYALTGDDQLRDPAQRALGFIVRAQHREGGWRYEPGQPGDTSVVGWQLMALKSGQMAYLHVPTRTFELAGVYLDKAQHDEDGSRYCYQPRNRMNETMTAEGLLCRQYLGWERDHPGLKKGVDWLLKEHPPSEKKPNIYYWYYGTQVMHHFGGTEWDRWNARMRKALVEMQRKTGPGAGSWDPEGSGESGGFADRGGRIFMTSLAACILEVYYRHMPIYGTEATEGFW